MNRRRVPEGALFPGQELLHGALAPPHSQVCPRIRTAPGGISNGGSSKAREQRVDDGLCAAGRHCQQSCAQPAAPAKARVKRWVGGGAWSCVMRGLKLGDFGQVPAWASLFPSAVLNS